jgi:rod shape-determining protein MreC
VLFSVLIMTMDHRMHVLKEVRSVLSLAVYPMEYMVTLPGAAGEWMGESLTTREKLMSEVISLKTQHLLLSARLQKFAALEAENERLRRMLDSSREVSEKVLIAELLSVDLEPFSRHIVLNKGSQHGIYEGQPVLDAKGIMGQVVHVTPLTSTIILITDPNHAIPVTINRNGMRTIAVGTGTSDELELPHFPTNTDVVVGDLLVSSGLGGRFPSGYPVGIITKVKKDPGESFAQVIAKPSAELDRNNEVLLVWPNLQQTEPANNSTTTSPAADAASAQPPAAQTSTPTTSTTQTSTPAPAAPVITGINTPKPVTPQNLNAKPVASSTTATTTTAVQKSGQSPVNPAPKSVTPTTQSNSTTPIATKPAAPSAHKPALAPALPATAGGQR